MVKRTITCDVCSKDITSMPSARGITIRANDAQATVVLNIQLCEEHAKLIIESVSQAVAKVATKE